MTCPHPCESGCHDPNCWPEDTLAVRIVPRRSDRETEPKPEFPFSSIRDPRLPVPPTPPSRLHAVCSQCSAVSLLEAAETRGGALSTTSPEFRVWWWEHRAQLRGAAYATILWAVAWVVAGTWFWFFLTRVICEVGR